MRVRPRSPLNFSGPEPLVLKPHDGDETGLSLGSDSEVPETADQPAAEIEADAVADADLAHEAQPLPDAEPEPNPTSYSYEPTPRAYEPAPAPAEPRRTAAYQSEGIFARSGRITLNLRDSEPFGSHEDDDDAPLILSTPIPNTAAEPVEPVFSSPAAEMRPPIDPRPEPRAEAIAPMPVPEPAPIADSPSEPITPTTFGARTSRAKGKAAAIKTVAGNADAETGRFAYWIAAVASVLWIGAVGSWAAYQAGLGELQLVPLNLGMLAVTALAPVGLIFTAARMTRQSAKLMAETRRARDLSEAMVAPAALAAKETVELVRAMRAEIDESTATAMRARSELSDLRDALKDQTRELSDAATEAGRGAKTLRESLGAEREAMQTLAQTLDQQASGVLEAVDRQARMVADASDLAQTQLGEAEAALAARAADLAAASTEAQDAARLAADDLARQTIRLETAGSGVAEQIRSVEEGLSQQRGALVNAAYALRSDQEDFSAQVETQRAQLIETLSHARLAAADLSDAAQRNAESLNQLVQKAGEEMKAVADAAERERNAFHDDAQAGVEKFKALAADTRDALLRETERGLSHIAGAANDARRLAEESVDAAQARITQLNENAAEAGRHLDASIQTAAERAQAMFDRSAAMLNEAGRRADEHFGLVTGGAEALIERSSTLLDQAGRQADERFSAVAARARAVADQSNTLMEQASQQADERFAAAAARAHAVADLSANMLDQANRQADERFAAAAARAHALVDQSAIMIDEAGERSAARLESNLAAVRTALSDLDHALTDIDGRAARLPEAARARVDEIKIAVEAGIASVSAAAQKAAAETLAVDAAFQDRVKRNYDMLTEAVRLMTVVNGAAAATSVRPDPSSETPRLSVRAQARVERVQQRFEEPATPAQPIMPEPVARRPEPQPQVQPQPQPEPAPAGGQSALRPRLRLTPTQADNEVKSAFEAAPRREVEGWTWRDLLNGMDNRGGDNRGGDTPTPPKAPEAPASRLDDTELDDLADRIIDEIAALGVDPNALLPRTRIEEAAAAYQRGDFDGARLVARRVAPAAVRRIARRILTEQGLRDDADRFAIRYEALIDEAARKDHDGFRVQALLNSDPGRAFLLIDAAIGDLN